MSIGNLRIRLAGSRKWVAVAALVAVVILAIVLVAAMALRRPAQTSVPAPRTATVVIDNNVFSPADLTVKAGTRVTWKIKGDDDDPYQLDANPSPFDTPAGFGSRQFADVRTYSYMFSKPGHYGYRNRVIPTGGGTVTVVP